MKMVVAIINKDDERKVVTDIYKNGFFATKLNASGNFLRGKNMILLIGTDDDNVDTVVDIVREKSGKREKVVVNASEMFGMGSGIDASNMEVEVGGAVIFVLNVESFMRV